jgi:hypothetical protein
MFNVRRNNTHVEPTKNRKDFENRMPYTGSKIAVFGFDFCSDPEDTLLQFIMYHPVSMR